MAKRNKTTIGLDIGGTNIKMVILQNASIVRQLEIPSGASKGPSAVRLAVHQTGQLAMSTCAFEAIGIGCAGAVDTSRGIVVNSPNFADWHNVPLKQWVESDLTVPVTIHNDANLAAVAEHSLGIGHNSRNFVLLTFGTGIGGGIILDNKLYEGSTGTAGELGHWSIDYRGLPCPCGNRGCFERYCSASALKEKVPDLSAEEVFSMASKNERCGRAVREFIDATKTAITSLANALDPDCIALGGGLAAGLSRHVDEIQSWVRAHAFPSVGKHVRIATCTLENWAGAIGAAIKARELLTTE